jgi:inosose dehydratase
MLDRLAGAPISWGVCEVPGWGPQLPPARVLGEMAGLGLRATELGPVGYLGSDPRAVRAQLAPFGLTLLGGFVPVVLHDAARRDDTRRAAHDAAALLAGAGAELFITAVVVDEGWSPRVELGEDGWRNLVAGLAELDSICAGHGLTQVLHPHVGTLVETAADLRRVLDDSDVLWCLDTGHLAIGGTDPVAFARDHHDRIGHVHLKDVRMDIAARVSAGELDLQGATRLGLFSPLGQGDVPIAEVVATLGAVGYTGWYVLEQDVALSGEEPPPGAGPATEVGASLDYLQRIWSSEEAGVPTTPPAGAGRS